MPFIEVAKSLIPGYELLTEAEQEQFQQTAAGRRFVTVAIEMLQPDTDFSIWNWFTGGADKKKEAEQKRMKEELLAELQDNFTYEQTISLIILRVLERVYPDFAILTPDEKTRLASADFSRVFHSPFLAVEEEINALTEKELSTWTEDYSDEFKELEKQRDAMYAQWLAHFKGSQVLSPEWNKIAVHYAQQRQNELFNFFPALNNASEGESFNQQHLRESRKTEPDHGRMEEEFLTNFIFNTLQNAANKKINFINLNNFNLKQSNAIAKQILDAFNDQKDLEMDSWLEDYQADLAEHIRQQLLVINGHERKFIPKEEYAGILSSLSYLFLHTDTSEKVQAFLMKAADAHAFIQYTGMSTQNEASWGFALDLINYFRAADQIMEARNILINLLKPFLPLYEEYKDIAFKEKNIYRKIIRTLVPLLIITAVVVGTMVLLAAMLSPLAVPEFAFLLAAIPALIFGLFLASQYIVLKNVAHNSLRRAYYGSLYEIPEFQVNQRMVQIFGSVENAERIRAIYIEEIELCDEKERSYSERASKSMLTQGEIEERKENLKRRYSLNFEWYDIHSNENLGYDKVPDLVASRLDSLFWEEVIQLEKEVAEHDLEQINTSVEQIIADVKAILESEAEQQAEILVENNHAPQPDAGSVQSYSSAGSSPQFFQPKSIARHNKATKLDTVLNFVEDLEASVSPR